MAGIFGVIAAVVTLFLSGVAGALEAEGANTVVGLGWGGMAFSFLTIVLAAVVLGTRSMVPGPLLMGCAVAGVVLGGTIVAITMVLAFVGGLLATLGACSEARLAAKTV